MVRTLTLINGTMVSMSRRFNAAFLRHLRNSIGARDECWKWAGTIMNSGYGQTCYNGVTTVASRAVYNHLCGEIPKGFEVHHTCNNGHMGCVNPLHLVAVSPSENLSMSASPSTACKNSTHCKNGHPFDLDNTLYVFRAGKSPQRRCRACHSARQRLYASKKTNKLLNSATSEGR